MSQLTRPKRQYYVYVIELADTVGKRVNPHYCSVYVGSSFHPPEVRFEQQKGGYRASRYTRHHAVRLRPRLYRAHNPLATREEAERMEAELARRLRKRGYTVYGGH